MRHSTGTCFCSRHQSNESSMLRFKPAQALPARFLVASRFITSHDCFFAIIQWSPMAKHARTDMTSLHTAGLQGRELKYLNPFTEVQRTFFPLVVPSSAHASCQGQERAQQSSGFWACRPGCCPAIGVCRDSKGICRIPSQVGMLPNTNTNMVLCSAQKQLPCCDPIESTHWIM